MDAKVHPWEGRWRADCSGPAPRAHPRLPMRVVGTPGTRGAGRETLADLGLMGTLALALAGDRCGGLGG